jgi:hypothetical protein
VGAGRKRVPPEGSKAEREEDKGLDEGTILPPGWKKQEDSMGQPIYINVETDESSYDFPRETEEQRMARRKKRKEEVLQLNAKLLGINKELRKLAREGGFVSSSLEVRKEGKESKQVEESREHVISMLRQGKELLRQTDAQVCLAASLRGPALLIYTSFRVSRVHVCGRGYSHSVTSRRLLLF